MIIDTSNTNKEEINQHKLVSETIRRSIRCRGCTYGERAFPEFRLCIEHNSVGTWVPRLRNSSLPP
jgi:hypothetical protein